MTPEDMADDHWTEHGADGPLPDAGERWDCAELGHDWVGGRCDACGKRRNPHD